MLDGRLLFVFLTLSAFLPEEGFAVSGFSENDSTEVTLPLDSVAFQELIVSGRKTPIRMQGDTLVFDVSCFYVPEGSKLRLLLERIPGLEVTGDGRILAKGKDVVRIKLNGKDFFKENTDLALNSMPVEILSEVRLYEEYSDEEEHTGVRRHEGEQVLDVYTQPDRSRGWLIDVQGAYGTSDRRQGNVTVSGFAPSVQGILSCSADNQPAVFGVEGSYLDKLSAETNVNDVNRQSYNGIVNFSSGRWEVNATAFLSSGETASLAESTTEYYLKDPRMYTVGDDERATDTRSANLSLDWVYQRESFLWSTKTFLNHFRYRHSLYTLSETREEYFEEKDGKLCRKERVLNSNQYSNEGVLKNMRAGVSTMVNKSWGEVGSNWDLSASLQYSDNDEDGFSHADIYYSLADAVSRQVQETHAVEKGIQGAVKSILTLAPSQSVKVQLSYGVEGQRDFVDRKVYDLSFVFLDMRPGEGCMPTDSLGKDAHLTTWIHDIRALLQYEKGAWALTAGVTFEPQRMSLHYMKGGRAVDSVQNVFSVLPELVLRYRRADRWNLSLHYMGRRKQPDLSGMLPIWDYTDPMHRYVGNKSLKPETNHILSCTFFSFEPVWQRQVTVSLNAAVNQQSIAQKTAFDPETGGYTVTPVNVNGNWSASAFVDFSTSFRKFKRWMMEWKGGVNATSQRALQERLHEEGKQHDAGLRIQSLTTTNYWAIQYRYRMLSLKPYAYMTLASYRNDLQKDLNADLWIYGGGGLMSMGFDSGLSIGVDFYRNCRAGYWQDDMNVREWICNLEVSYSFLKSKSLEVKLQGFDVLRELHSVNQVNTVTFRQETINRKGVNSYFMLSLSYHFDRFPSKG